MFIRLLVISLTVVCIVMGVHYFHYQFGIGPGLPNLNNSLALLRPTPVPTPSSAPTTLPATSSSTLETLPQQLGNLLAVPLLLDETGIASGSVSLAYVKQNQPAIVILFGSDLSATVAASVTSQLHQLPNPPVVAVDHEGGIVQRLAGDGFTKLPSWQQLCALSSLKRVELIASSAAQLKAAGIDLVLGPVVDLSASGSALRTRSCSSDPEKVSAIAQELIDSYKQVGLATMLKHYPGIGSAQADLHTRSAKVLLTPDDTRPFEALLATNPAQPVMLSHVRIDPADPLTPCSQSPLCVGELPRVYPDALLVTDALEMKSAGFLASSSAILRPLPERATASLRAGADILLFGPTVTESDINQVQQRLVQDFTAQGQPDEKTLAHIGRVKRWRASLAQ